MSSSYEATIRWPRSDASDVIVTGSFDGWSCTQHLSRSSSGNFQGTVKVPWGDTVTYKYIVDGRWTTTDDQPTELDPMGNLNNILRAPARPASPRMYAPPPVIVPSEKPKPEAQPAGKLNGFVETAKQAVVNMVEALAPGTAVTPAETPVVETAAPVPEPVVQPAVEPKPVPEPTPAPAEPEAEKEEVVAAVQPSAPVPVAPVVLVPILPLNTESSDPTPVVDIHETKAADATIPVADAPVVEPSTHTPAPLPATEVAVVEEKPATNGTSVNGATESPTSVPASAPEASPVAEKPASTNGTSAEKPPASNGTDVKYATVNGKASSPKKMRFPSFSSRHSRARSSLESGSTAVTGTGAGELGEKTNGATEATNGTGKDTLSKRFKSGTQQREKRKSSMFGKLKDVFSSPKKEAAA